MPLYYSGSCVASIPSLSLPPCRASLWKRPIPNFLIQTSCNIGKYRQIINSKPRVRFFSRKSQTITDPRNRQLSCRPPASRKRPAACPGWTLIHAHRFRVYGLGFPVSSLQWLCSPPAWLTSWAKTQGNTSWNFQNRLPYKNHKSWKVESTANKKVSFASSSDWSQGQPLIAKPRNLRRCLTVT